MIHIMDIYKNVNVDNRRDECGIYCIANNTDKYDPAEFMIYNNVCIKELNILLSFIYYR